MQDYIVTVMARDRVGIVRDVSSALAGLGGNITHLSQTVMRGYFTLIISVTVDGTQLQTRQAIERSGGVGEFEVNVRSYEESETQKPIDSERFTLTMQGKDQPGIIARTSAHLADRGINLDDYYAYVQDGVLLMLAQVSVPAGVDVDEVQRGLQQMGLDFGLVVHLQHDNIFRATGDIRPVAL